MSLDVHRGTTNFRQGLSQGAQKLSFLCIHPCAAAAFARLATTFDVNATCAYSPKCTPFVDTPKPDTFAVYKFFQLLGYDELLDSFSLLKGKDKLQKQDVRTA